MFYLTDFDGRRIQVGTRVRYFDFDPEHSDWGKPKAYYGTVIEITEWEGDCDYEGRPISIQPEVIVDFDDGDTQGYPTSEWVFDFNGGIDSDGEPYGYDEPYEGKCEELCVIGPPDVGSVKLRAHG